MTETKSLAQALAALQTQLPKVDKAKTAKVKTDKANYTYDYADLAQITRQLMPILGELGLSFTAKPTVTDDGRFVLAYKLLHVSGESEKGQYPLPAQGTPQSMGSAITYARRYCLCAVTGVAPEDDDDGAAAEADARTSYARPEPPARRQAEPETDWEWLNGLETRVAAASTLGELRGLWTEMTSKQKAGQLTDADRSGVAEPLLNMRKAELEGSPS
jgi:ERF superfamily protein